MVGGEMAMPSVSRYHPFLVTLHWVLAVLIVAQLAVGYFVLAATPNADPQKIGLVKVHLIVGVTIFVLMLIRFIVRLASSRPDRATTGSAALDRLAPVTHYGFYLLVLLMVASGFAMAIMAGIGPIVFGHGGQLPPDLRIYPPRIAHGYLAVLLAAFILLHLLAALYHQLVRNDGLLRRMWFGTR
jgi:cytochrome b561